MPNKFLCSRQMAAFISNKNERTIRRWCDDGVLFVISHDNQDRAMLDIAAVLELSGGGLKDADGAIAELIMQADQGGAAAQNDLGAILLSSERYAGAFALFQLAAAQNHADAMHFLYQLHQRGLGTSESQNLALMWLAKAAHHGHKIAIAQVAELGGNSASSRH